MGLVKIPNAAKEKFKSNFSAIIDKGELAEGAWNNSFSNFVKKYQSQHLECSRLEGRKCPTHNALAQAVFG